MKKICINLMLMTVFFVGGTTFVHGQSLKDIVKSTLNHFRDLDLEGTWSYEGAAIEFESESLLTKAGGKVAASQMEKKVNDQLNKLGFESGVTKFTFNADSTFTQTTKGKTSKGTYVLDDDNNITLKYGRLIPVKAKLTGSVDKISLLYEASGFLSIVTFIGGRSGISAIKNLTSLLNAYDGMMVGIELRRQ